MAGWVHNTGCVISLVRSYRWISLIISLFIEESVNQTEVFPLGSLLVKIIYISYIFTIVTVPLSPAAPKLVGAGSAPDTSQARSGVSGTSSRVIRIFYDL